jgi:hypothetical protein
MHAAERYAASIAPAIPEDYARVCVHGVRVAGGRRAFAEDTAAHFWSVFGALKDSAAVECFGEFASKSDAWTFALELSLAFDWPIWDCKRAEERALKQ